MFQYLKTLSNNHNTNSLANRLRRKRFKLFLELIADLPRPLRILDIGGTVLFWEQMHFTEQKEIGITLLNLKPQEAKYTNMICLVGDARNLSQFDDNEFDIAFSNSVIEHVGSYDDQKAMAGEMHRIARKLFVQSPNYYFPMEPHFLFPFFQFLPLWLQVKLMMNFNLGWFSQAPNKQQAINNCRSVRLLSKTELQRLFPEATIYREYFFGFVKSFIAIK